MPAPNLELLHRLDELAKAHPEMFASDFAKMLGYNPRYIRKLMARLGHSRPTGSGGKTGARNPSWRGGRSVSLSGYILLSQNPKVWEHRQVAAVSLGRELTPEEVVDHIDGITIHNNSKNLRVFSSNGVHLAQTARGPRKRSRSGVANMFLRHRQPEAVVPVDTHALRQGRGDVRLRALLRASLELGIGHPCLLRTTRWLEKAGIDPASRSSLERGWDELCGRYEEDLLL